MRKIPLTPTAAACLDHFLEKYGNAALIDALRDYDAVHETYMFKNRHCTRTILIRSIYYVEIYAHTITFHTSEGDFEKYGVLNQEYDILAPYGFVKCSQSVLVPVSQIKEIKNRQLTLATGKILSISRSCAPRILEAYTNKNASSLYQ